MSESEMQSISKYVLDSYAILVFLNREQGWEKVRDIIRDATHDRAELHMSLINMAEVRYTTARRRSNILQIFAALEALPITIASADAYVESVINLKTRYPIALTDCFAAALAIDLNCPLITGDPEFKKLEDKLQVEWLR